MMLDLMMAPIPAISLLGQLRLVSAPKSFIGDLDLLRHAVYGLLLLSIALNFALVHSLSLFSPRMIFVLSLLLGRDEIWAVL